MDIFHEQLIKVKPTPAVTVSKISIWTMAVIIALISGFFAIKVFPLLFFVSAGVLYLAYRANCSLSIEYEYIFTNGTLDVDKIINKSSRKRVVSFDCKNIEGITKYKPTKKQPKSYLCTDDIKNAVVITANAERIGKCEIIISPNDDIKECMKRYIPRSVLLNI